MYTVEFEPDASVITSIDELDKFDDVEMILADDGTVFIRQFEDHMDEYQLITMSYQQLLDLITSLHQTEGMFKIEFLHKRNNK
jgi:hypothetical protein